MNEDSRADSPPGLAEEERIAPELPRRRALRFLGGVVGAAAGAAAGLGSFVLGCRDSGESLSEGGAEANGSPVAVEVSLDRLPDGARLRITVDGRPVELSRNGERVTARSLLCTHFACTVGWDPERQVYVCPCHDGMYAPDGRVLAGPPSLPLPVLPVERTGDTVLVWARRGAADEDAPAGGIGP